MMMKLIKLLIGFFFVIIPIIGFTQEINPKIEAESVNHKLLEQRVKYIEDKFMIQLKALEKKTIETKKNSEEKFDIKSSNLEKRMDLYLFFAGAFIALISFLVGFFGRKSITDWIQGTIEGKTSEIVDEYIKEKNIEELLNDKVQHVEGLLQTKGEESVSRFITELETRGDQAIKKLEKIRIDYEKSFKTLETKKMQYIKKAKVDEPDNNLVNFPDKLKKYKKEDEYTPDDWYYRGLAEYNKGDYEKALFSWTKEIELDPKYSSAYTNRSSIYINLKQYEKAIDDATKAIELDPKNAVAYTNRSGAYAYLKQYEKAIDDATKAIELDPKYSFAYTNRSSAYLCLKQYEKVIDDATKAIELDPKNAVAYTNRSGAYAYLKQYEKAIDDAAKAIELNPKNTGVYSNLFELQLVTGDYNNSLELVNEILSSASDIKDRVICLYFKCIIYKLLNKPTIEPEKQFNEILSEEFMLSWSFNIIEDWLEKADISEETKQYIIEKIGILKIRTEI